MKERLFFFVPDVETSRHVVDDLTQFGIGEQDLHIIAKDDVTLEPIAEPDLCRKEIKPKNNKGLTLVRR